MIALSFQYINEINRSSFHFGYWAQITLFISNLEYKDTFIQVMLYKLHLVRVSIVHMTFAYIIDRISNDKVL